MTTAPVDPPATAGEVAIAQLDAARAVLSAVTAELSAVFSAELAAVAASAAALVAEAEAARAAVVLEAADRGVIAASDHPRPRAWVEQSCREADVPVTTTMARQLGDIGQTCLTHDVKGLRAAVIEGRLSTEVAATVAATYRRLRAGVDGFDWDELLETLIGFAATGPAARDWRDLEDRIIGQYGTQGALEDEHEAKHRRRGVSDFHTARDGMRTATVKLDPASEEVVTAALNALSKPQPTPEWDLDLRSRGQRRADALVALAGMATAADPETPGTGAKARVTVTVPLADLLEDLADLTDRTDPNEHAEHDERADSAGECSDGDCDDSRGRHAGAAFGMGPRTRTGTRTAGRRRGHAVAGFGSALSAVEARLLACDAQIIPMILGSKGEILDQGRTKRTVTPAQSAALAQRDRGCTYPTCDIPPQWCDGHHIIHWANGGPSDLSNLALLCRHHHTQVHRRGHTATVHPVHGVRWRRHDGTPIGNTPRTPRLE